MKRKLSNLAIILIGIFSLALLVYPHLEHWLSTHNQSYVVRDYEKSLDGRTQREIEDQFAKADAYNQSLGERPVLDPFSQEAMANSEAYNQLLAVDDSGMMGHIKIPKIQVDLPIYHGTSETVLKNGVGHMKRTALPIGGLGNHSVLTGHTGLSNAKMFTDLIELDIGDEFYIYVLDRVLAYRVVRLDTVLPHETELLKSDKHADYTTLVTCTPYGINSHRLLVRGERVDYSREEIEQRIGNTASTISMETYLLIGGLLLPIIISTIILIFFHVHEKRQKKQDLASSNGTEDSEE